jgi:hypothetical protein
MKFDELVAQITGRGREWHKDRIIENTRLNADDITRGIDWAGVSKVPHLIISAGPSLYSQNVLWRLKDSKHHRFKTICTDGSYVQCLRAGLYPDYCITLDPHPTRMVRWFGDPNLEENSRNDDYFTRQDLDIKFRENAIRTNAENIDLVDKMSMYTTFIIATTAPRNVVERLRPHLCAWFVPLVDDPAKPGLTRTMLDIVKVPALNTGGTVGTAAWCFAHVVKQAPSIAVVGMDMGYQLSTPLSQTQSWNMLKAEPNIEEFYPRENGFWGAAYTDPTYHWYRNNFLQLLKNNDARVMNCSGAGLLQGPGVLCCELEQWLAYCS